MFDFVERPRQGISIFRLGDKSQRTLRQGGGRIGFDADNVNWDMPRREVDFQPIQYAPAIHIWQVQIQSNRSGLEVAHHRQGSRAALGHHAFKPFFVGQIQQDPCIGRIILDN